MLSEKVCAIVNCLCLLKVFIGYPGLYVCLVSGSFGKVCTDDLTEDIRSRNVNVLVSLTAGNASA